MRDLIRRAEIPTHADPRPMLDAFASSIFPEWFWEVKRQNSFFHRIGYSLLSILRDIDHEQLLLISKFNYEFLDITKSFYAKTIDPFTVEFPLKARFSQRVDVLFDDIYTIGKKLEDLGEEELSKIDQLRTSVSEGNTNIITEDDLDKIATEEFPINIIKNSLEEGENILSGQVFAATTRGRTISFGEVENTPPGVIDEGEILERVLIIDNKYALLDPLTIEESIEFANIDEEIINVAPEIIGRIEANGTYNNIYDLDKDGYISPEDVSFLQDAIGKSVNNTPLIEWRRIYSQLDIDNDGIISPSDVSQGINAEGAVSRTSLVIRNITNGSVKISYLYHPNPFLTFFSDVAPVFGGDAELNTLLDPEFDIRIKDGFVANPISLTVGISIDKNEIWAGRRSEINTFALTKIARPEPDRFIVRGITGVDNAAFILVSTEDGQPIANGEIVGTNIAIVRIDLLREAIEYTEDIIPIEGITLEEDETPTGIVSTLRKDTFRIFTSLNNIHTIRLSWNSVTRREGEIIVSQDVPIEKIATVRLFNDIDNFGFNLGQTRNLGEPNDKFYPRIREAYSVLQGSNDIEGMHIGTSRELGLYIPVLSKPGIVNLINTPVPDSISIRILSIRDSTFLPLGTPETEEVTEVDRDFIDETVRVFVINEVTFEKHTFDDGSILIGNTLLLSREFLLDVANQFIKANPTLIFDVPNLDERLIQSRSIRLEIVYDATDPDDVLHPDLAEQHNIELPSIDQLEPYIEDHNSTNSILPIHPDSTLAKELVHYYKLADEDIDTYIGEERTDEIIEDIRLGDKSTWDKTEIDIALFDQRFRSDFIVRKTEFDSNVFDDEIIEVEL